MEHIAFSVFLKVESLLTTVAPTWLGSCAVAEGKKSFVAPEQALLKVAAFRVVENPVTLATTCHHLPPLATTCHHLPPLATTCHHLPPLATTCQLARLYRGSFAVEAEPQSGRRPVALLDHLDHADLKVPQCRCESLQLGAG